MKHKSLFLSLLICLCLAPMTASAQGGASAQAGAGREAQGDEREVLRLEELGRQKALKGETSWDDLIADGAYMIGFDGSVVRFRKGQAFPPLPLKSFTLSDMIARSFGEVVVVTGLAELEGETPQKQLMTVQQRYMNVWKKVDGGWKIVVSERTPVRQAPK